MHQCTSAPVYQVHWSHNTWGAGDTQAKCTILRAGSRSLEPLIKVTFGWSGMCSVHHLEVDPPYFPENTTPWDLCTCLLYSSSPHFKTQTDWVQSFQSLVSAALFTCFCGSLKGNGWGVNWLSKSEMAPAPCLRDTKGDLVAEANKSKRDPQLAPLRVSSRLLHLYLYLPFYLSFHMYLYLYLITWLGRINVWVCLMLRSPTAEKQLKIFNSSRSAPLSPLLQLFTYITYLWSF